MKSIQEHIILIGFKHVGKTSVGRELAVLLGRPFVDLDDEIEAQFERDYQRKLPCRTIMQEYGQPFFRGLESKVLHGALEKNAGVIALGGGTPLSPDNQAMLTPYTLVHVTASRDTVFSRIMEQGRPTFFPAEEDPRESFQKLWTERDIIYRDLADFTVQNDGAITEAIKNIESLMKERIG